VLLARAPWQHPPLESSAALPLPGRLMALPLPPPWLPDYMLHLYAHMFLAHRCTMGKWHCDFVPREMWPLSKTGWPQLCSDPTVSSGVPEPREGDTAAQRPLYRQEAKAWGVRVGSRSRRIWSPAVHKSQASTCSILPFQGRPQSWLGKGKGKPI
jgi:hypothetical protein